MDTPVIAAAAPGMPGGLLGMPDGLLALAAEARAEGVGNVCTLLERWDAGTERFDGPGESLLVAVANDAVVAVGGLSRCPDVAGALRVRRFYVAAARRRQGIGSALATELISRGSRHATTLTCNARATPQAAPFWEAMGFEPLDVPGITHRLTPRMIDGVIDGVQAAGRRAR